MSRDAKQIGPELDSGVWFSLTVAVAFGIFAAVAVCARAQNATPQQARPAKHSTSQAAQPGANQKTFDSAQEAADALAAAARSHDETALIAILGPGSHDIVMWTDNSADRDVESDRFAENYREMHRLVREPDEETTLYVGPENWPLPIPIVDRNGRWYFDANLGRREILYRRIGENEMTAVDVLHGIIDAENQYFANSGASGSQEYATRFNCNEGKHDGLYSAANGAGDDSNAVGPFVAEASWDRVDRKPFRGYYFGILTEQGPHAHGGARNYVVDGKMTGGFAIVAFPAMYRVSGVKSFIANQHGAIYEKDLGRNTTETASTMKSYDPDNTWMRVRANQMVGMNAQP